MNFIAFIATASHIVDNGSCDVSVVEADEISYNVADDGTETPVYGMSDRLVMDPTDLDVSVDDPDKLAKVEVLVEDVLNDGGWTVADPWEVLADGLTAMVERA